MDAMFFAYCRLAGVVARSLLKGVYLDSPKRLLGAIKALSLIRQYEGGLPLQYRGIKVQVLRPLQQVKTSSVGSLIEPK
jgi:hypothetical protein